MPPRRTRTRRLLLTALTTAVLLTLSGCLTVHGEKVATPAVTEAEAARVLQRFGEDNNQANRTHDIELNARIESGPLAAIDRAGLRARAAEPRGPEPHHRPLTFRDARFLIPRQTGTGRWFIADAGTNRGDDRWLLVFVRERAKDRWKAAYLAVLGPDGIPEFATGRGGHLKPVPTGADPESATAARLTVPPAELSQAYATYLREGAGDFAPGPHTSERREERERHLRTPQYVTRYADLATPEFEPVAARLRGGGAIVFFASRHRFKQTVVEGRTIRLTPEVEALLTGTAKRTVTLEHVSVQAAVVPPADRAQRRIEFLGRTDGLVKATGS